MNVIKRIANKFKLFLIEDCALSLGATYNGKHTGLFGDAGVFSFYPAKHITTGEGGMLITKNKKYKKRLKFQNRWELIKILWKEKRLVFMMH